MSLSRLDPTLRALDGRRNRLRNCKIAINRTLDRPLDGLLNRLLYASRLTAHALPANIRPAHIVPARGALANLVDAMEVETTHRLGNKLRGGSAGSGSYRAINQGWKRWVWNYHLPLFTPPTHSIFIVAQPQHNHGKGERTQSRFRAQKGPKRSTT